MLKIDVQESASELVYQNWRPRLAECGGWTMQALPQLLVPKCVILTGRWRYKRSVVVAP